MNKDQVIGFDSSFYQVIGFSLVDAPGNWFLNVHAFLLFSVSLRVRVMVRARARVRVRERVRVRVRVRVRG